MKVLFAFLVGVILAVGGFWFRNEIFDAVEKSGLPVDVSRWRGRQLVSPLTDQVVPREKPLEKFSFVELAEKSYSANKISLIEVIEVKKEYISYVFSYEVDGKTVTGMANIPEVEDKNEKLPVIVMARGFVDQEIYETGIGTRPSADVYAKQGFITLAPDFLGYGESDAPENDVFWERFSKVDQMLQLLASVETLPQADATRVGLWGHSNGGQIVLSVLEVTGKEYPTVLWAPVSKPFPYSILYYTDEADDEGMALRRLLANLEWDYDVREFSISSFWDRIKAPIQLHQGSADDAVPQEWSDELADRLRGQGLEVVYYVYPNSDHNLRPAWNTVVGRDVDWFNEHLKQDELEPSL